jgi:hypothetical protein
MEDDLDDLICILNKEKTDQVDQLLKGGDKKPPLPGKPPGSTTKAA